MSPIETISRNNVVRKEEIHARRRSRASVVGLGRWPHGPSRRGFEARSDSGGSGESDTSSFNDNEEYEECMSDSSSMPSTTGKEKTVYAAVAALSSLGAFETGYLAFMSLTHGQVACPIDGASCTSILNSSYAYLWDTIPLSLLGCVAYSSVAGLAYLGTQGAESFPWMMDGENSPTIQIKKILLGGGVLLGSTSLYLLYILTTVFSGEVCPWCLGSMALSFCIAILLASSSTSQDLEDAVVPGAGLMAATVLMLSVGLGNPNASVAGSRITRLDFKEPEITNESSDLAIRVARRLKKSGAEMFGAFWCGHCYEQKQAFGKEAMQDFPYVECFPDGWYQGVEMASSCKAESLNGFPTWVIGGKKLEGEQSLQDLDTLLDSMGTPNN